jgi:hypothetical protein
MTTRAQREAAARKALRETATNTYDSSHYYMDCECRKCRGPDDVKRLRRVVISLLRRTS